MNEVEKAFRELKRKKWVLRKHEYLTIKGQILSGDVYGAMKGLDKILKMQSR